MNLELACEMQFSVEWAWDILSSSTIRYGALCDMVSHTACITSQYDMTVTVNLSVVFSFNPNYDVINLS